MPAQTIAEGLLLSLAVSASDPDPAAVLRYSLLNLKTAVGF
jgi:hypothetical protein